jgi:DNA-binding beta-propeller fold protein YncE
VRWGNVVGFGAMFLLAAVGVLAQGGADKRLDLPSSKQLGTVPGVPQRTNSMPAVMAVSPDGRYVVTVNSGYGTWESGYAHSLSVLDTQAGKLSDVPEPRAGIETKGSLYLGVAFSGDGRHVYASLASLTSPTGGKGKNDAGNGIAVYGFADGKLTPERMLPIGLQPLAAGRKTALVSWKDGHEGVPFPAGIAVVPGASAAGRNVGRRIPAGSERLLVADDLSDDALLIDAATGRVVTRFDLSESDAVPGTYPVAVAVSKDGARGFVALWNASELVELDLKKGVVGRKVPLFKPSDPVRPGSHPCAMAMSPDGKTLYVALANRDAVAAIEIDGGKFQTKGFFDTRLPGQSYFGAEPDGVAVSADGRFVYAANMGSDAVAVIDTHKLAARTAKADMVEPVGFIPTEWMPVSLAAAGGRLYVATAKGRGTGPNNRPQHAGAAGEESWAKKRENAYIGTLLYGSLASIDVSSVDLKSATAEVLEANRMKAGAETIPFAGAVSRIKHVIYIIKENRTYDQVFGDLTMDGKPVGNGDKNLTMYGADITPNEHKLALQFGVLDNFFDSGEVSGDGHVWSNAAIGTDYLERTWPIDYRNSQRTYDFEGVVAAGYPLLQKIADVVEPTSGYMWGNADAHGKTHYNFGEYVSTTFCNAKRSGSSEEGPVLEGAACARPVIKPGDRFPEEWGGEVNQFGWAVPMIAKNTATKPELVGHFATDAPDFNLRVPDQVRAEVFARHFAGWVKDRAAGNDSMPNYITMHMGNDHTAGTTPGGPTPRSSVADNDLALGRIVEAVSHSPYWDDTAIFVLEDDAQNGADHVDAHRSLALVISKYSPHAKDGGAFVDSRFYTTVSVIRTMEMLLGLPPMNNNDAFASAITSLFTGPGDQIPFTVDTANRENGLIYKTNAATAVGAKESLKMDFTHEDRADARKLNVILWRDAKGDAPIPAQVMRKAKKGKDDDD